MQDRLARWSENRLRVIYILITLLALSSCSSQPAQVVDRDQPPSRKIQEHRVSSGETLYSIAWRYDLDHNKLARRNQIQAPFTIYPGQLLKLDLDNMPAQAPRQSARRRGSGDASAPSAAPSPAASSRPADSAGSASRSKNQTPSRGARSNTALPAGTPSWRWPVEGRVLRAFGASSGLNQGIDIGGNLGDSVRAAAAGQVVYAGSGLRGYGNLVILKHNETYLSAYAHNRSLNVSEGDAVKAGGVIAEMGSSGTDKVKLYFEIRRDGKPVDPIGHLPRR